MGRGMGRDGFGLHPRGREALTPDGVSQRFDRLVARHEIPPIRLHDLRHVAATLALTAGVDIKVVSEQLGHSTTQITRDVYLSVMPQVAQAAAEATAAIVPRAAKSADVHDSVDTLCAPGDISDTEDDLQTGKTPGQKGWGGWDSNPRPRDHEVLRAHRCTNPFVCRDSWARKSPYLSESSSVTRPDQPVTVRCTVADAGRTRSWTRLAPFVGASPARIDTLREAGIGKRPDRPARRPLPSHVRRPGLFRAVPGPSDCSVVG